MKAKKLGRTILLALLLAVLTTGAALAAEGDQIELTGYITELNPIDGTITVDVDGDLLTTEDVSIILVGDKFIFDNHDVGDLITVQGTVGVDDVVLLTELKIMARVKDQIKSQDGELDSYYCTNDDVYHPVAAKVAATYGVDYGVIEDYLCGEPSVPLGQIMLAIQTAAASGDVTGYTEYLDGFENISWGQIWQELEVQGKPDHGKETPPGQIQDKQGEGDSEEPDANGKMNKDGEGSMECEEGEFLCNVSEWFQSQSSQKGKK